MNRHRSDRYPAFGLPGQSRPLATSFYPPATRQEAS